MTSDDRAGQQPNELDDVLLQRLGSALELEVPPPADERVAAVRAAAALARREHGRSAVGPSMTTRRALLLSSAAAAVGAVGGAVVAEVVSDEDDGPTSGPPTEPVTWQPGSAAIEGATYSAALINHTWGVELLLDATGFTVGQQYSVVYERAGAAVVPAGGFVGAELPIRCRCNGALLRGVVTAIEIRDAADGVVARAELPA